MGEAGWARHQAIAPFTRFLAGPAEYTTMVFTERRRDTTVAHQIASLAIFSSPLLTGRIWFLAAMNGPAPRSVRVPLTFLGTGEYDTYECETTVPTARLRRWSRPVSDRPTRSFSTSAPAAAS
jgi:hypothetical protein